MPRSDEWLDRPCDDLGQVLIFAVGLVQRHLIHVMWDLSSRFQSDFDGVCFAPHVVVWTFRINDESNHHESTCGVACATGAEWSGVKTSGACSAVHELSRASNAVSAHLDYGLRQCKANSFFVSVGVEDIVVDVIRHGRLEGV